MKGLSQMTRFELTIAEIEYSDEYDDNIDLFEKGIDILKNRMKNNDVDRDFNDEEREILEEVFSRIGDKNE